MNTRKLNLITEATTAFPGVSINDAILLFLRNRYSSDQGLSDLIARYLYQSSIFAYNFDGVDDYAVLPYRAINPDGDIDIEFYTPSLSGIKTIIYQGSGESDFNQCDFWLLRNGNNIEFRVGGAGARGLGILPENEKFRVTLVGTALNLFNSSGSNILSGSYTRGTYRSNNPVTVIGARLSSGLYVNYFQGIQRDIKINGTLWPMADRNQVIQLPAGAEAWPIIYPTSNVQPLPLTVDNPPNFTVIYGGVRSPILAAGTYFLELDIQVNSGAFRTQLNNNTSVVYVTAGPRRLVRAVVTIDESANRCSLQAALVDSSCVFYGWRLVLLDSSRNPMQMINTSSDRWQEIDA